MAGNDARAQATPSRGASCFIAAMLLVQLGVPAHYYLTSDDRFDERFSWRMFSAIRDDACTVDVTETKTGAEPQRVSLVGELHPAWVESLARNRRSVVDRVLRGRCEGQGVERAEVQTACQSFEETYLRRYTIDCATLQTRVEERP